MSIVWITSHLGTGPASQVVNEGEYAILDVRDLVDKAGNSRDSIREKVLRGCELMREGKKVVVCCDYGISRSNAIAVGILSQFLRVPFEVAARRVMEATGGKEIKAAPLKAVREALSGKKRTSGENPRILITGGSGGLGKRLVEAYSGKEVLSPSRDVLELRKGSMELDILVGENDIDCIIHLANPRVFTSNIALGDSLTILKNVLDVCVAREIKLIYLSGWEVYSGYRTRHLLADESLPLLPKGPYGETKVLCEFLIDHFRRNEGLQCTILRSGPVFGVGLEKPKFIYTFIEKIRKGISITTHQYRNGNPALDMLYIDDMVSAIISTVECDFSGNLNLGTGILTETNQIAKMLNEIMSGSTEIGQVKVDSDTACVAMDSSKAKTILSWQSTVTVKEGLQRIVSFI